MINENPGIGMGPAQHNSVSRSSPRQQATVKAAMANDQNSTCELHPSTKKFLETLSGDQDKSRPANI